MDHALLRAFVAVAEAQSFSLAAQSLHLTQPAISKRIASLEAELEQRLFDRVGHDVYLTPAGKTLLPRAQQLLLDMQDTATTIRNLSGRVEGVLRIATSHHIGLRRLPRILREFTLHYPQVTLEFDFLDSEPAFHEVGQGQRELAIITLPGTSSESVEAIPIWRERLLPCVHREHPLAKLNRISIEQLASHRAVLLGGHTFTQQRVNAQLTSLGLELGETTSSTYLEAIAMLVTAGQGWALLPDIMITDDLKALKMQPMIQVERALGVVHHRNRSLSNAAKAMIEMLTSS